MDGNLPLNLVLNNPRSRSWFSKRKDGRCPCDDSSFGITKVHFSAGVYITV